MFAVYAAVAVAGFLLFDPSKIDVLIMQNLTAWPGGAIVTSVALLVSLRSYSTLSALVSILAEVPERILGLAGARRPRSERAGRVRARSTKLRRRACCEAVARRALRTALFGAGVAAAYCLEAQLDLVEAVTGTIGTFSMSVILPIAFYIRLHTGAAPPAAPLRGSVHAGGQDPGSLRDGEAALRRLSARGVLAARLALLASLVLCGFLAWGEARVVFARLAH